jgi:DNA primase
VGIVDEDIDRVRSATDFVALVGEHVALNRQGTRWVGLCPFHGEKSPSFSVNGELGLYYCFGCGAKGDAITFLREVEHLDFVEAVEKLAGRSGITLHYDDEAGGRDRQRRNRIHETIEAAVRWYHERLLSAPDAAAARAYLRRERGYDGEVVRRYQLGWAPEGWSTLVKSLGVPAGALVDAGLATVDEQGRYTDFFRGRLLFPIIDPSGRAVGAGGRLLPGGRGPKYKNTSNTAVYDKSRTLYGLNWAKKSVVDRGRVVVCEGYTDVIGLHRSGVEEAVATCGTALAEGHIKLLTSFARRIVLAYDGDSAGQAAAERVYEWEKKFSVEIRVLALPAGADPADLARSDPEALRAAVEGARPFLGFRLERLFSRSDLSSPEGRSRSAQEAVAMVAAHPDVLVRDQYLMEIADRCRVDAGRLRAMADDPAAVAALPTAATPRQRGTTSRPAAAGPGASERAGGRQSAEVTGPELEALRLRVQHPETTTGRLERCLLSNGVARRALDVLDQQPSLHEALQVADPQVADLLQRLAVEESDTEVDDVMFRLVGRAAARALKELQAEMRQAAPADQPDYARACDWLTRAAQQLRIEGPGADPEALEAERMVVGWLRSHQEGTPEP